MLLAVSVCCFTIPRCPITRGIGALSQQLATCRSRTRSIARRRVARHAEHPAPAYSSRSTARDDKESQWVSTSTTSRPRSCRAATRTFARLCASLTEEAEAIGWYEQRIAVETDPEALAVMRDAQGEEFKHFSMDLEFLLRRSPAWREIAQGVLFRPATSSSTARQAEAETFDGNGAERRGRLPAPARSESAA